MTIVEDRPILETGPKPPLGVMTLLRRSFALLGSAFLPLVGSCYFYTVAMQFAGFLVAQYLLESGLPVTTLDEQAIGGTTPIEIAVWIVTGVVVMLLFAVLTGALLDIALKRTSGQPLRAGEIVGTGFRFALPMVLSFFVVGFLIALGFMALVVPGLWLVGVYGLVPAVMIAEGRARGVFARTRRLTKEYRWPLVGFIVLVHVAVFIVSMVLGVFVALVPVDANSITLFLFARAVLLDAPVTAVTTALLMAALAVAYLRLIEIKEGAGGAALRAVFE